MKIPVQSLKVVADYINENQLFYGTGDTLKAIHREAFLPIKVGLFQTEVMKS